MTDFSKLSKQQLWKLFKKDQKLTKKTSYQLLTADAMRDVLQIRQDRSIKKANQSLKQNVTNIGKLFNVKPVFTSPETHFSKALFGGEP